MEKIKETVESIYKKIFNVKKECVGISKDATNPHFKSQYATLGAVLSVTDPLLEANNLLWLDEVKDEDKDGLFLETTIINIEKEDDKMVIKMPLLLDKNDMQKLGSAITYSRRYQRITFLGLTVEDDDGNKASNRGNNSTAQKKKSSLEVLEETIKNMSDKDNWILYFKDKYKVDTLKKLNDVQAKDCFTELGIK